MSDYGKDCFQRICKGIKINKGCCYMHKHKSDLGDNLNIFSCKQWKSHFLRYSTRLGFLSGQS